jgi:hypothetical protein
MKHQDFPALYLAADDAAVQTQKRLLLVQISSSVLLILGAAATVDSSSLTIAIASALLFLASLFVYIYGQHRDLQGKWYQSRALAESIKTATWRWMMSAEPFHNQSEPATTDSFRRLLEELLSQNKNIGDSLAGDWCEKDQITRRMLELRQASFADRKAIYLSQRIEEQRTWYSRKAKSNRHQSRNWFIGLCVLYGIAILLLTIRIATPNLPYWPIEVIAVSASAVIAWMQLKRFNELASAYALTAHEIGIIKTRFASVTNADLLSRFVSDAENAFSREHTQWAARRDH